MAKGHTKEKIMSYDKLNLASFTASLKENKYESATGARRAVGKATTLSDSDKEKARKLIDAHFGAGATVAKTGAKKASAKTGAKKASAKKAAAQPKKAAAAQKTSSPKKASSAKKTEATRRRQPVTSADLQSIPATGVGVVAGVDFEDIASVATQIRIAEKTVQNVGAALNVITQAKKEFPDAELQSVIEDMGTTLSGAVGIFRHVVNQISKTGASVNANANPQIATPTAPAITPPAPIVNGGVGQPSRGESLFRESQGENEDEQAPNRA